MKVLKFEFGGISHNWAQYSLPARLYASNGFLGYLRLVGPALKAPPASLGGRFGHERMLFDWYQ